MGLITKQALLSADDLKTEVVECPEWQADVMVTELSGEDLVSLIKFIQPEDQPGDFMYARAVARCAVDEDRQRLFVDDDYMAIARKNPRVVKRVGEAALRLNCLLKSEDEVKNSEPGAESSSSTD